MQEVTTIRPSSTSISPLFQSAISEAPVNLFRMKVQSQAADAKRMSFVWRSPGAQLLLSPSAYLEFDVEVTIPHNFSRLYNIASIQQVQNIGAADRYAQGGQAAATAAYGIVDGPGVAFGEGNAVMSCVESIQYTINGASISHSNWYVFKRSLDSVQIPPRVAQRCFSRCGGSFNRYDSKCVSTALANAGYNSNNDLQSGQVQTAGMTCDSGLSNRLKNFADNITSSVGSIGDANFTEGVKVTVKVQCPLDGGVFNQVWGETGMARSSVYSKLCLAIPNANSMSCTILFKDLEKALVRRLGRNFNVDQAGAGGIAAGRTSTANNGLYGFGVKFKGTQANLHLQWLRLQSFRRYPEAVSLATYRTQTYLQEMPTAQVGAIIANADYSDTTGFSGPYLLPSGPDFVANTRSAAVLVADSNRTWTAEFQNVQFSQPPSYLFFVAQKSSDCYSYANPTADPGVDLAGGHAAIAAAAAADITGAAVAGSAVMHYRNVAQNQDSNLSIVGFKLLVQSSVGTFEMTSDSYPRLLDTNMLWDVHKRNACSEYLEESGIMAWNRRCSCLCLSSAEYLHGLGTSFGVAFPIQISATLELQNRCCFSDGIKYSDHRSPGPILFRDYINARCALVGIFDRQVLQISTSSAVLSAQNFTAATASSLLANRG